MKSGQALNTALMAASRSLEILKLARSYSSCLSGHFDLRDERGDGGGLGGAPGGHGGLRRRRAGLHQGEGGEQQPQAGPAAGLHQLQPVH